MNISPVSFGKVVEVRGKTNLTASNIASLANSPVENKTHKAIQQDAKELFNDVTPDGPVRVYNWQNGRKYYLVSGKDSENVAWYAAYGQKDINGAREHMPEGAERERFISDVKRETAHNIKRYITSHMEPYAITIGEVKGEHRIQYEIE